jgi:hypothetical protein
MLVCHSVAQLWYPYPSSLSPGCRMTKVVARQELTAPPGRRSTWSKLVAPNYTVRCNWQCAHPLNPCPHAPFFALQNDYSGRETGVDRTTRQEIDMEEAGMRLNYKHRKLQGKPFDLQAHM